MHIKDAATQDIVMDVLESIENKLYETGLLASATGDPESDVSLRFTSTLLRDEKTQALEIAVTSVAPGVRHRLCSAELRNYVLTKYADLQADLPGDVREALLDGIGPVVTLNGTVVTD